MIGQQNSRHFFNQWKENPKPIATCTRAFSRGLSRLHVVASYSDWLVALLWSVVIGWSDWFGFGFTTQLKTARFSVLCKLFLLLGYAGLSLIFEVGGDLQKNSRGFESTCCFYIKIQGENPRPPALNNGLGYVMSFFPVDICKASEEIANVNNTKIEKIRLHLIEVQFTRESWYFTISKLEIR